ncbi:putative Presenilin, partial [Daphnia magna]
KSQHVSRIANHNQEIDQEELEDKEELKYEAAHVITLFVPVSLCMMVVVATISSVTYYTKKGIYLVYTPFHEDSPDTGTKVWNAVANSSILPSIHLPFEHSRRMAYAFYTLGSVFYKRYIPAYKE